MLSGLFYGAPLSIKGLGVFLLNKVPASESFVCAA